MPIRNRDNNIIGCAQIANRLDNQPFDENDEQLFEAFCIFCGLGINNTLIYDQLERSMAEKSVALEVLSYHATCPKNELATFINKYEPKDNNEEIFFYQRDILNSFIFDDFSMNIDEMILASYEMFKHSGLMNTFQIDKKVKKLFHLFTGMGCKKFNFYTRPGGGGRFLEKISKNFFFIAYSVLKTR